ncbi:MAG TPA: hypothetical protein VF169_00090 [Albitalea sp.]
MPTFLQSFVHVQAIGSMLLLVGFLLATTALQQRASYQVLRLLENLPESVKATEIYAAARSHFERRDVGNLFTSRPHKIPIWFLVIVVGGCSFICYFGAELFASNDQKPSYVLGGIRAAEAGTSQSDITALSRYQSETVFIGSMAFLAAYVWMINQLVNRINNEDMNPITYYFLSVRLLAACLVAGISRHVVEAVPPIRDSLISVTIDGRSFPAGLAILGFLIGWNPTLWIDELLVKVRDLIKSKIPSQRWPLKENLPCNMSLLMLQGMVPDKIDRLNELNIDNVQKLTAENPIVLWARTSYTLDLVLDFIDQAHLAVLFDEERLKNLRDQGVRDIWSYALNIETDAGRNTIAALLHVPMGLIEAHHRRMDECPTLVRLSQLRSALRPIETWHDADRQAA